VIAIIGIPVLARDGSEEPRLVGLVASVALAASAEGAAVQLISKLGDDPDGDAALLAMGRAGIGHVATLRDAAHRTPVVHWLGSDAAAGALDGVPDDDDDESIDADDRSGEAATGAAVKPTDPTDRPLLDPADVELALRYLPDIAVVVVIEQETAISLVAAAEATAASAHVIVVLPGDGQVGDETGGSDALPAEALLLAAPTNGDRDAFGILVGRYAALVDKGTSPKQAFDRALAGQSAERATS